MIPNLLLSISPEEIKNPYNFKVTDVNVYSLEEAIYYFFHNWKHLADEFVSDGFIAWVNNELGLSFIASKIKKLALIDNFSERLISFLSVIHYFDEEELSKLKDELLQWEERKAWENLKEQGDYLFNGGLPEKAFVLYKKALASEENIPILNNMGICLMHTKKYDEAASYFLRAYYLVERIDSVPDSSKPVEEAVLELTRLSENILFNLTEAYIYGGNFSEAEKCLSVAERFSDNPAIYYFYGEIDFFNANFLSAIKHYEKAVMLNNDKYSILRLADAYVKLKYFDKAIEILKKYGAADTGVLIKQAEVYAAYNDIPASVRCIERALIYDRKSVKLWTLLSMYCRKDYNLEKAELSIRRALAINPDNELANLEFARIKKASGKMKDYQTILQKILKGFKNNYRDIMANLYGEEIT